VALGECAVGCDHDLEVWRTPRYPLTAIDLETTGLTVAQAQIVQIAIIAADEKGVERDHWSALIVPLAGALPRGFEPQVDASVRADAFAQVADQVVLRLTATTIVAHNAAFDLHVLTRELARAGRSWRPGHVDCTLTLARARLPGRASYRLGDLARELGLPRTTHEALADARCALALYRTLMSDPLGAAGE
jgi:DNA polymerase-3 subunit epsilon